MIKGARMLDTYIHGYQFNRKLEILKSSFINNYNLIIILFKSLKLKNK